MTTNLCIPMTQANTCAPVTLTQEEWIMIRVALSQHLFGCQDRGCHVDSAALLALLAKIGPDGVHMRPAS